MNPYISLQPEWLANLLAHREFGLAHPRAFVSRQSATGSPFFGASPTESRLSPNRSTSDALVLGIFGEATRKPPIGLFDTGEFDHSEASNYPGIQSAPPSTRRVPTATSIATGTSDALVLRLLDEAASKRPPVALFNTPSVGRQTASGLDIPPSGLHQNALDTEGAMPGIGMRRQAAETVIVEEPRLPPSGDAPPRPDSPDDPEFEVIPVPGTGDAIFVPKYPFRLVDPRTGKVLGGRWREGEGFRDKDTNENKKPDSMESGNVGGMNPNDLWILLERIF